MGLGERQITWFLQKKANCMIALEREEKRLLAMTKPEDIKKQKEKIQEVMNHAYVLDKTLEGMREGIDMKIKHLKRKVDPLIDRIEDMRKVRDLIK